MNTLCDVRSATRAHQHDDGAVLSANLVHVLRSIVLAEPTCHVRLRIDNFAPCEVELRLTVRFGADFADVFEVRGTPRARRGMLLPAQTARDEVVLAYHGLDGVERRTRIRASLPPSEVTPDSMEFRGPLPAWLNRLAS